MRKDGARNAAKPAGGLSRGAAMLIGPEGSTQPAGSPQAASPLGGFSLRRWIVWVSAGEALGFAFPVTVGVLTATLGWAERATYPALVVAGLVEGALLGWCQAQLLRQWQVLPCRRDWVVATSAGAAVAWSMGLIPSVVGGLALTPTTVVLVALGGLVLLISVPVSQYLVLRRHLDGAWRWIPINVLAWSAGLLWTLVPSPFIDERTPPAVLVIVYAIAGLGMAATVALISGLGLRHMLATQPDGANQPLDHERVTLQ